MKEGLYVHVDEVKNVIDTFGSKGGTGMTIINDGFILSEIKERSDIYITHNGNMIRRKSHDKRSCCRNDTKRPLRYP